MMRLWIWNFWLKEPKFAFSSEIKEIDDGVMIMGISRKH